VKTTTGFNPQYITDSDGQRIAVILSVSKYEELLEDLQDLAVIAERRNEPTIPHQKVIAELKTGGHLSLMQRVLADDNVAASK